MQSKHPIRNTAPNARPEPFNATAALARARAELAPPAPKFWVQSFFAMKQLEHSGLTYRTLNAIVAESDTLEAAKASLAQHIERAKGVDRVLATLRKVRPDRWRPQS